MRERRNRGPQNHIPHRGSSSLRCRVAARPPRTRSHGYGLTAQQNRPAKLGRHQLCPPTALSALALALLTALREEEHVFPRGTAAPSLHCSCPLRPWRDSAPSRLSAGSARRRTPRRPSHSVQRGQWLLRGCPCGPAVPRGKWAGVWIARRGALERSVRYLRAPRWARLAAAALLLRAPTSRRGRRAAPAPHSQTLRPSRAGRSRSRRPAALPRTGARRHHVTRPRRSAAPPFRSGAVGAGGRLLNRCFETGP